MLVSWRQSSSCVANAFHAFLLLESSSCWRCGRHYAAEREGNQISFSFKRVMGSPVPLMEGEKAKGGEGTRNGRKERSNRRGRRN